YSLARWLNAAGVRTHRGSPFENRTVEYILRNPVYIGKLRWNPTGRSHRNFDDPGIIVMDGKHEPLISEELFHRTQRRIAQSKAAMPYHGRPLGSNKDWISGLVRCAACGGTMVFAKPHWWKCNNYVRGRCTTSQHINGDLLKDAILRRLQADSSTAADLHYEVLRITDKVGDPVAALRAQRVSTERRLERLREAFLSGIDTMEEYRQAKEETQAQLQRIDEAICEAERENHRRGNPKLMRNAIRLALATITNENATLEQRCAAARSIIEHIDWDKAQNQLTIHYRLLLD
ncbi:MAG: hypothetical protein EGR26_03785, partial [Clostridiales bacterium]|nr:hypothetical protein [Clostridiales bacterium]